MGHFHCTELKEGLAQCHSAEQHLSVAHVAGAVFVGGTSSASTNPVHVLVAFRRVLSKVDASTEHATNVGVALVETFVDDGVDEWRTMKEHPFIVMVVIFICDFFLPVRVSLP